MIKVNVDNVFVMLLMAMWIIEEYLNYPYKIKTRIFIRGKILIKGIVNM